jgi:hypothetical protein
VVCWSSGNNEQHFDTETRFDSDSDTHSATNTKNLDNEHQHHQSSLNSPFENSDRLNTQPSSNPPPHPLPSQKPATPAHTTKHHYQEDCANNSTHTGPSRCFPFWQEVLACYVTNTNAEDDSGKAKCVPVLEDYYECLHHKKEVR